MFTTVKNLIVKEKKFIAKIISIYSILMTAFWFKNIDAETIAFAPKVIFEYSFNYLTSITKNI